MNAEGATGLNKEIMELIGYIINHEADLRRSSEETKTVDAILVSNAFMVKAIGRVNVRLTAIEKKVSQQLKEAIGNQLVSAHQSITNIAKELVGIKRHAVFQILKSHAGEFLKQVLSGASVEKGLQLKVIEAMTSRHMAAALVAPSECGFTVVLEEHALKEQDTVFQKLGKFTLAVDRVAKNCEFLD